MNNIPADTEFHQLLPHGINGHKIMVQLWADPHLMNRIICNYGTGIKVGLFVLQEMGHCICREGMGTDNGIRPVFFYKCLHRIHNNGAHGPFYKAALLFAGGKLVHKLVKIRHKVQHIKVAALHKSIYPGGFHGHEINNIYDSIRMLFFYAFSHCRCRLFVP